MRPGSRAAVPLSRTCLHKIRLRSQLLLNLPSRFIRVIQSVFSKNTRITPLLCNISINPLRPARSSFQPIPPYSTGGRYASRALAFGPWTLAFGLWPWPGLCSSKKISRVGRPLSLPLRQSPRMHDTALRTSNMEHQTPNAEGEIAARLAVLETLNPQPSTLNLELAAFPTFDADQASQARSDLIRATIIFFWLDSDCPSHSAKLNA
jgi:hypothetical protein